MRNQVVFPAGGYLLVHSVDLGNVVVCPTPQPPLYFKPVFKPVLVLVFPARGLIRNAWLAAALSVVLIMMNIFKRFCLHNDNLMITAFIFKIFLTYILQPTEVFFFLSSPHPPISQPACHYLPSPPHQLQTLPSLRKKKSKNKTVFPGISAKVRIASYKSTQQKSPHEGQQLNRIKKVHKWAKQSEISVSPTPTHVMAGQRNPIGRKEFYKQTKESPTHKKNL